MFSNERLQSSLRPGKPHVEVIDLDISDEEESQEQAADLSTLKEISTSTSRDEEGKYCE